MRRESVDLLRAYLSLRPELRGCIRLSPPCFLQGGRWRQFTAFRMVPGGLILKSRLGDWVRLDADGGRRHKRSRVRRRLVDLLTAHLGPYRTLELLYKTDRNRHHSAAFLRMLLRSRMGGTAVVAPFPEEGPELESRFLAEAVLWWDQLRQEKKFCNRLVLAIPESWGRSLPNELSLLKIPLRCFQYRLEEGELTLLFPRAPEVSEVRIPFVMFPFTESVPQHLERLVVKFPALDLRFRKKRWELCRLGFPVAWVEGGGGAVFYDLQNPRLLISGATSDFEKHLQEVCRARSYPPEDPRSFLYRFESELWLESRIVEKKKELFPFLGDAVYCQVPTFVDGERRILDLLTVTEQGRLAVMEIKVGRDIGMVFQGLSYWSRVWQHLKRGDFERAGYFRGVTLSRQPPLLYLVSPLFEIHRVTAILSKYLLLESPIQWVGVNSDWRRTIRVLRRFEFSG